MRLLFLTRPLAFAVVATMPSGMFAAPASPALRAYAECNANAAHQVAEQQGDPLTLAIGAEAMCASERLAIMSEVNASRGAGPAMELGRQMQRQAVEGNTAAILNQRRRTQALSNAVADATAEEDRYLRCTVLSSAAVARELGSPPSLARIAVTACSKELRAYTDKLAQRLPRTMAVQASAILRKTALDHSTPYIERIRKGNGQQ